MKLLGKIRPLFIFIFLIACSESFAQLRITANGSDSLLLETGGRNTRMSIDSSGLFNFPGLTADRAVVIDGSGNLVSSTVTEATLNFLDATSSVQAQLDDTVKDNAESTMTTASGILFPAVADSAGELDLIVLPQRAGIPTATPTTGEGATVWDSSNDDLFIWTGASWKNIGGVASTTITVTSQSSNYTVLITDDLIITDATSGAVTLSLFTASGNTGEIIRVKKTDTTSNTVVIDGSGAETIDGATTFNLIGEDSEIDIVSDGTNWIVMNYPKPLTETYSVARVASFWDATGMTNDFDISLGSNADNILFIVEDSGGITRIRAKVDIDITITAFGAANANTGISIRDSGTNILTLQQIATATDSPSGTIRIELSATDHLFAEITSNDRVGGITITATNINW